MNFSNSKPLLSGIDEFLLNIADYFGFAGVFASKYERTVHLNHHGYDLRHLTILKDGERLVLEGIVPAHEGRGLKCFKEHYVVGKRFKLDPQRITYDKRQLLIPITVFD